MQRGTRGTTGEDSLLARKSPCGHERIAVADRAHVVDHGKIERADHEIMANAFDPVDARLGGLTGMEQVTVDAADRVRTHHPHVAPGLGGTLLEISAGAGDGAPGANAADQTVDESVGVLPDLRTGGQVMGLGVGRIVVLVGIETAGGLGGNTLGDLDVTLRVIVRQVGAGHHDLGTVGLEHVDLLAAHLVGHRAHAAIAAHRRGDREAETGVSGGAFDQRPTRRDQARLLGAQHHVHRHAVLDRAPGVQLLELCQHGRRTGRRHAIQAHQRGVSDQVEYGIVKLHRSPPQRKPTGDASAVHDHGADDALPVRRRLAFCGPIQDNSSLRPEPRFPRQ